jgi:hypothetical protein
MAQMLNKDVKAQGNAFNFYGVNTVKIFPD